MKKPIFILVLAMSAVACKKGGVCVVERQTVRGPEKVCEHGVSFDYYEGSCAGGTFHPYSSEGKTSRERGEATCRGLGVRAEAH